MQEIKLENIIIGRVEPHIYAFTTGTVPNYLKVGDTYRPVSLRLNEWKEHFPDLEKKYENIQKRIAELEKQFEKSHESQSAIQTNTFTLGRQVIEMQQLYTQMQSELQRIQQQQIIKNTARTR